jgi:hypothetical protein
MMTNWMNGVGTLVSALLMSCGVEQQSLVAVATKAAPTESAPELLSMAEAFRNDFPNLIEDWPAALVWKDQPSPRIGVCERTKVTRWIEIDPVMKQWPEELKALVWHEMAHCAMNLAHDPEPDHIGSAKIDWFVNWTEVWPAELERLVKRATGRD